MARISNAVGEIDKEGIHMSEHRHDPNGEMDPVVGAWHGWASPIGLGLFFVLLAVAFDLVRFAFK
jgi:hypothetical protein